MTRRSRQKKKRGIGPVKATALLVACCAIAAWRLLPTFGLEPTADFAEMMGFEDPVDADEADASQAGEDEVQWTDLLAAHGSFKNSMPVRVAFSALAAPQALAAPGGETAPSVGEQWVGEDPPLQRLGVVMVSEHARRAVFGGAVVGVGDAIAGGRVLAIEPGWLLLSWHGRELTYDLDDVAPREFRSELRRRAAEAEASEGEEEADVTPGSEESGLAKEKE